MSDTTPRKSLGQHWLFDAASLDAMLRAGEITKDDTVLEVGPGLGTLTEKLCQRAQHVIAVELDDSLVAKLAGQVVVNNLKIVHQNILEFDTTSLPENYKLVANIPYYLTSNLVRVLLESPNPPSVMVLLIQKEVAERIVAQPGAMGILSVATQFYAEVELKEVIPAELFTPPPKVDSQIIKIVRRKTPLFPGVDPKHFFTLVRAGFSEKRKKLRSSLSGGLQISKTEADELLKRASLSADARAQELSLGQWHELYQSSIELSSSVDT